MTTAIKQYAWLLDANGRPKRDSKGALLPQVEVFTSLVDLSNGSKGGLVVAEISPPMIVGAASAGEIQTPATTAASTTVNFASGLKGIVVDFHAATSATPVTTLPLTKAKEVFVEFNFSMYNDVAVPGLRKVVAIGAVKPFRFSKPPYPTSVTIITDLGETTLGDSKVSWEAVSYE